MAGEWLKMECDTPEKPEVMALTASLGWTDTDLTVGKLFKLWRWFDKHTIDGNAAGVTSALLDAQIGVTGFCQAVAAVGWLEVYDGGIRLPKFDRHNGTTAKSRSQTAKRVANFKANAKVNGSGNATTVTNALPREEKRREEGKSNPLPPTGGDSADAEQPVRAIKGKRSPIPYDDILAAFRHALPDLEQPQKVTNKRRREIGKAWEYLRADHRTLGAFRAIFAECAEDPFYNGTGPYRDQNANWRPTFDFIIREDQFAKIYDRAMTRQQQRRAAGQAGHPVEAAA